MRHIVYQRLLQGGLVLTSEQGRMGQKNFALVDLSAKTNNIKATLNAASLPIPR